MAMGFGNELLDRVYTECFKPAVAQTGFELRRLDEEPRAGLIDNRLRVEIRRSRFLIAELTGQNLGAYWESGFAEGLGLPVIYSCQKDEFERGKVHFDTNHQLAVPWEESALSNAGSRLKEAIRATLPTEANMSDD